METYCRRLCFNYSSERGPCPQASQWHPRVAKGSSIDPLAREPSTEPLLGQVTWQDCLEPVSNRLLPMLVTDLARRPCPQMSQGHLAWHTQYISTTRVTAAPSHRCPHASSACQKSFFDGLRTRPHPPKRYLRAFPRENVLHPKNLATAQPQTTGNS